MATVTMKDPSKPISFEVALESPHVVFYRLWYKEPGDEKFTILASGSDEEPSDPSSHTHTVGPLKPNSKFAFFFHFIGNPKTAFRGRVRIRQDGEVLTGGSIAVSGTIPAKGHTSREGRRDLK
jgi:hypothetical protein